MRFIITGLPRSGHAWLANYLYKGDSIVSHEGALSFTRPERSLRQAHIAAMRVLAGDCSSSWLLYPDLLRLVPRVVVVERSLDDVRESFLRELPASRPFLDDTLDLLRPGLRQALRSDALVLPYESSYSLTTVERICGYVGEEFDLVRFALLRHTRVTQASRDVLSAQKAELPAP